LASIQQKTPDNEIITRKNIPLPALYNTRILDTTKTRTILAF